MNKPTKKAPSTTGTDKNVGDGSRVQDKKENKTMNQITKAFFGVTYLVLKISFLIAGVALWKMPTIHAIFDIPLYQIVGSIILLFLVYLELYAYFTKPSEKKSGKKPTEKPSALDKMKLAYEG